MLVSTLGTVEPTRGSVSMAAQRDYGMAWTKAEDRKAQSAAPASNSLRGDLR